ncbi:MAG: ATP-dependent DNA helicase RecG, partial [Chlamydiota bacterium]|nr:ATP-dependent DNA helicase RecG [Chlamydiota bacterium]
RRMEILEMILEDDTGSMLTRWFNQGYLIDRFKAGDRVILSGKVTWYHGIQMINPDYEILAGDETDTIHTGRIVPMYSLTEKLTQRSMRLIMKNAVDLYGMRLEEIFTPQIKLQWSLINIHQAIHQIHYPDQMEDIERARYRVVFEEFFLLQLAIELKRRQSQKMSRVFHLSHGHKLVQDFIHGLPFELTQDQHKVIADLLHDMEGDVPMNRLLQGDVGSGKTVLACCALYLSIMSGAQAVLMVPSEVLAQQHYENIKKFFEAFSMKIGLLVGEMNPHLKKQTLDDIRSGNLNLLIGTHAILEEKVVFHKLGLVVIDEQHKFGVIQRHLLRVKSQSPDVLVMTATPIPRTMALTLYGDLDISVIKQMPPGRGKIHTAWIKEKKIMDAYEFIAKQISQGRQAFIIYPLVEESEKIDLKAVTEMFKKLSTHVFPKLSMGLIHGRLPVKEKNAVLNDFKKGMYQILVSTTVIEVGIDIPNATIMLIENAERFGLAQLHQLRGRIGRGPFDSYCILESDPHTEEGIKRMKAMVRTRDGFEIAEEDLSIRGPGEILGTRQHGMPELRVASLAKDVHILELAKHAARDILNHDPELLHPEHARVRHALLHLYEDKVHLVQVG